MSRLSRAASVYPMSTGGRRVKHVFRALGFVALVAGATATVAFAAPTQTPGAVEIVARDYDLGVTRFRQPGLTGRLARIPIRLWGTIAAPAVAGPHPVVLVAHGAHGDNCPGEFGTWPCFPREQRNDLGLRYLVRGLAHAGFVALAPDMNALYTAGFGEVQDKEPRRFADISDALLAELARANTGASRRFGIPLRGKVDLTEVGVLGHSRGGMNALAWVRGKPEVASVFLLAPAFERSRRIGDVSATVALGTCDDDTGLQGARYFSALRASTRTHPAFQLTLTGANHNFYNRTLVRLGNDDAEASTGKCAKSRRLKPGQQQTWLKRVARDHFTVTLLDALPARWMTPPPPTRIYGRTVAVKQLLP